MSNDTRKSVEELKDVAGGSNRPLDTSGSGQPGQPSEPGINFGLESAGTFSAGTVDPGFSVSNQGPGADRGQPGQPQTPGQSIGIEAAGGVAAGAANTPGYDHSAPDSSSPNPTIRVRVQHADLSNTLNDTTTG